MSRRRHDLQNIDTSTWPTVDPGAFPASKQKTFEARHESIELYASGNTVREIEKQTGINSRQLYWLLDRCLTQAPDGQLFGFRGLLKHRRVAPYARIAKLSPDCSITRQGFVGAFALLLERFPALTEWLKQKIHNTRSCLIRSAPTAFSKPDFAD
jgi:putative transposase